jgi:hypothetical protein
MIIFRWTGPSRWIVTHIRTETMLQSNAIDQPNNYGPCSRGMLTPNLVDGVS